MTTPVYELVKKVPEELLLVPNENGEFELYSPYTVIECRTEGDFNWIKAAVEKQRPNKPKVEENFYGLVYSCPVCGFSISNYRTKRFKFCVECGQKIDWEVKE